LPERRSGSKIFAGTAFHRVPAPLHPVHLYEQHDVREEARRAGPSATADTRTGKKVKGSPYSITERRVPELIPVLGSQPAGDVSHKNPAVGSHYFPPGLQLPPQPLRGLLPISLLGEQRHSGC